MLITSFNLVKAPGNSTVLLFINEQSEAQTLLHMEPMLTSAMGTDPQQTHTVNILWCLARYLHHILGIMNHGDGRFTNITL